MNVSWFLLVGVDRRLAAGFCCSGGAWADRVTMVTASSVP